MGTERRSVVEEKKRRCEVVVWFSSVQFGLVELRVSWLFHFKVQSFELATTRGRKETT